MEIEFTESEIEALHSAIGNIPPMNIEIRLVMNQGTSGICRGKVLTRVGCS